MHKTRLLAIILCLLILLAGCSDNTDTPSSSGGGNSDTSIVTPPPAPDASASRPTRPVTTTVTLADGKKKIDVTIKDGMNAIGDDGDKFTGGYSRGNMSEFN